MATVQNLLDILEEIAPADLACGWDNTGLLVGSPSARVAAAVLALDPTVALLAEAAACSADAVITHHPALFHPLKQLRTDSPIGGFLAAALRVGIHVIGCHTNFDAAPGGVNDVLAHALSLPDAVPLLADAKDPGAGMGRIGTLPEPVSPAVFLRRLKYELALPWLLEAGPRPQTVARIALCGGAGSDLAEAALAAGADVLLTAEVRHHTARWAEEAGLWLLDGGHFATEWPAMRRLQALLTEKAGQAGLNVQFRLARQASPLTLAAQEFFGNE